MSSFDFPPSWSAGYAIPANVLAEPPRRSTLPGGYPTPRGTFDDPTPSPPWDPGYAIPANVLAEPLGRGTRTTRQLARKTIGAEIPRFVAGEADIIDAGGACSPINALSGTEWMDAQAWRYGLGDTAGLDESDLEPLDSWSERVTEAVLAPLRTTPVAERGPMLTETLNELEAGLAGRVRASASRWRAQGMVGARALRRAIADNVRAGLLAEVSALARNPRPAPVSLVGLGAFGADKRVERVKTRRGTPTTKGAKTRPIGCRLVKKVSEDAEREGYVIDVPYLPGTRDKYQHFATNGKRCMKGLPELHRMYQNAKAAKGGDITNGKKPFLIYTDDVGRVFGLYYTESSGRMVAARMKPGWKRRLRRIVAGVATVGASEIYYRRKAIARQVKKAAIKVGDAIGKVADMTCQLLSSERGQLAVAAGATAAGAPPQSSVVGTQVAAGLCAGGPPEPPAPEPFPIVPMLLGGAALVGVALLATRK